jgi:hypothetical protein
MKMRVGQAIAAGIFALSLLAGIGNAGHVSAAEMDKGAFKQGCEEGHGSYVENNDGSFQCNLQSGGTIKCPDTKSQCSYSPTRIVSVGGGIKLGGAVSVLPIKNVLPALAADTGPSSVPDHVAKAPKHHKHRR